jgi:PAS domain S-box-containing protein
MRDKRGATGKVPQTGPGPSGEPGSQRRRSRSFRDIKTALRARGVQSGDSSVPGMPLELASAFEHATTAIALVDAEHRILAANTALCELIGLPRRDMLTSSLSQLLGIGDEGFNSHWLQHAVGGTPVRFECPLATRTGCYAWVLVDVRPLPLQGRSTATAVVTLYDITERKQEAERLAETQSRVAMAFEVGRAALWEWDLEKDEIVLDDSVKAWLGYTPDEVRQRTDVLTKLHPDDLVALTGLGEILVRNAQQPFEFVARIATKAGDYCSLLVRGCAVRPSEGQGWRIVGVVVDISERKRALEMLLEQQRRFTLAALAGRVTVYDYDLASGKVITDPAFTQALGLGSSPTLSRDDWVQRIHPDDRERILAHEAAAREPDAETDENGNTPIPEVECRLIANKGETVWLLLRGTLLRTLNGQPHRVIGTATDITQHRRAEEALRESEARYRALAGRLLQTQDDERRRIAQELHGVTAQNLSALSMNLTRIEQLLRGGEGVVKRLLDECSDLGAEALNEVRTLSYVLHPPLLDEAGLVSGLRWYIQGFSARSGIAVKLVTPAHIERLPRDLETAFFRIMQECLTNIHRHSGSTSARVSLTQTATHVALRVSDRGHGMEDIESWPDELVTVGVGIAGMRQCLRQLGGSLRIRSTRQGTTITASVPIIKESDHAPNSGGGRP